MRAQLARHARRVLISHARSPSCAVYSAPSYRRCLPRSINHCHARRSFFDGLFSKAPREIRQPEFEPGWMKIMVWRSRMLDNLRPPPTEELVEAWRAFFRGKANSEMPLNGTQAMQCRRLFNYLVEQREKATTPESQIQEADATEFFQTLISIHPREKTGQHVGLIKDVWSALSSGKLSEEGFTPARSPLREYAVALCTYAGAKDGLEVLNTNWDDLQDNFGRKRKDPLLTLLKAFADEGNEQGLVQLAQKAEEKGVPYDKYIQAQLVSFFAQRDRVAETQYWFEKPILNPCPHSRTIPTIASFAVRNNLQDWVMPFFLKLGDELPGDATAQWGSLFQGILIAGGLKAVEKMMSHKAAFQGPTNTDIGTINSLLRVAARLNDLVLAEEILSLAVEKGCQLDGDSHLSLMTLRLRAGYMPGVYTAFKKVAHFEPWHALPSLWRMFCQQLNQYLMAICAQKTPDFKIIGEIVEYAEENRVFLEPQTIAVLCVQLLENEQHFDVMDLLSIHAFHFSAAEREVVQGAFVEFCLKPETSTARAWTGYQLLRQYFQDLSFELRVKLMEAFFARKRPDMAVHVFGHMRQHRNSAYHPTRETYISCFEGLGRNPDLESLEMVYNMFKMDTSLDPNTKLYTSLILAHTACEKPLQAWDFWRSIVTSREGPSYASLEAIFWALEHTPRGSTKAQGIWKRIQNMDIDVPPSVYSAYVGAIAGSAEGSLVKDTIMRMAKVTGSEPDAMTLGVAFNALPGQQLQSDFRNWAKVRYPDAWAELELKGKRVNEDSLCQFKLNRVLAA
ncbi:hypothetical protein NM208_g15141 [Fusarium decemcellulare]|uniref:Uncharacterized protein n=1 Tax=Fusarium decemcellulare TaxID=57161 RepID=A0ACC1RI36_9HYPO|nr:hypothetical protein NM208_g15141 [Fusarium decemcellulare]